MLGKRCTLNAIGLMALSIQIVYTKHISASYCGRPFCLRILCGGRCWNCGRFARARQRVMQAEEATAEAAAAAPSADEEPDLNEYEMERLANIERNRMRLLAILADSLPQAA